MTNNQSDPAVVYLPWPSDDAHTPEAVRAEVTEWLGEVLPDYVKVIVADQRAPDTGYPLVRFIGAYHDIRSIMDDHADRFGDESVSY